MAIERKILLNSFPLSIFNGFNYDIKVRMIGQLQPNEYGRMVFVYTGEDFSHDGIELALEDFFSSDAESYLGHQQLVDVLNNFLAQMGWEPDLKMNRSSYRYRYGDIIHVIQYRGKRLPEGATTLPEGVLIDLWKVEVKPVGSTLASEVRYWEWSKEE